MNSSRESEFAFTLGHILGFLNDSEIIEYLTDRGINKHLIEITCVYLKQISQAFYKLK